MRVQTTDGVIEFLDHWTRNGTKEKKILMECTYQERTVSSRYINHSQLLTLLCLALENVIDQRGPSPQHSRSRYFNSTPPVPVKATETKASKMVLNLCCLNTQQLTIYLQFPIHLLLFQFFPLGFRSGVQLPLVQLEGGKIFKFSTLLVWVEERKFELNFFYLVKNKSKQMENIVFLD